MSTTDQVYRFIIRYKSENDGNSPSVRDICDALRINSTSVCSYHLRRLVQDGRIGMSKKSSRSIVVVGGQWNMQ